MANPPSTNPPPLRIPILHQDKIVDEKGMPTQAEWAFRQSLTTSLQNYIGNQGLVIPVQNQSDANLILNNQDIQGTFTCQLGTMLYIRDSVSFMNDKVVIAVRNDNTYPVTPPIFKQVTLT